MAAIQLIAHASVIIETGGVSILCDPWFSGKAFNDSWSLAVPPAITEADLDRVDYLWVSHEHPDHFHFPTLRALPESFKKRVTVLFRSDFTEKVASAFQKLGFASVVELPHRTFVPLTSAVKVFCYHSGSMDAALAIVGPDAVILNNNDAELSPRDCEKLRRDVGSIDVILDQFGLAGFPGIADYDDFLRNQKQRKLQRTLMHVDRTQARYAIPFASFQYFSHVENRFMNQYLASPREVSKLFGEHGHTCVVLYPGERWQVGAPHDSEPALQRYDNVLQQLAARDYDETVSVALEELAAAHDKMVEQLGARYPRSLLRGLGKICVEVTDYGCKLEFDLVSPGVRESSADPMLQLCSQPLLFAFTSPYGFQTLGVSARYRLLGSAKTWRRFRILFSLNNAGLYLKPRFLLRKKPLGYVWSRRREALDQLKNRISTMFG